MPPTVGAERDPGEPTDCLQLLLGGYSRPGRHLRHPQTRRPCPGTHGRIVTRECLHCLRAHGRRHLPAGRVREGIPPERPAVHKLGSDEDRRGHAVCDDLRQADGDRPLIGVVEGERGARPMRPGRRRIEDRVQRHDIVRVLQLVELRHQGPARQVQTTIPDGGRAVRQHVVVRQHDCLRPPPAPGQRGDAASDQQDLGRSPHAGARQLSDDVEAVPPHPR